MYMLSSNFGLCNYYLKREGSVMFVVILCILFCDSIYMCALQYCRQVKSINEKVLLHCAKSRHTTMNLTLAHEVMLVWLRPDNVGGAAAQY